MLIFSRRRLSASAENISCHWVCEIIRVIHDPVARNVLCASLRVVRLEKINMKRSSRTRKKIRSFLSKNFLQDFSVFTEKISKKTYPLALVLRCWFFETAPLSERREHFLPLGLWNYQGYSRPSGKYSLRFPAVVRLEKINNMRGAVELAKK